MTREQFAKYRYRHSEIMILHERHPKIDIEVMLLGVDFDNDVFKVVPFDTDYYEEEPIWVNFELIDKKLRTIICNKEGEE